MKPSRNRDMPARLRSKGGISWTAGTLTCFSHFYLCLILLFRNKPLFCNVRRKGSETLDCWEWNIGTFLFISDAWPNFNEEIWGNMGQYKAILWGQLSGTKRVKYLIVDKKLAHSSNQRCATQLLTTGSLNSCLLIRTSLLSSHVPTALDQSSY